MQHFPSSVPPIRTANAAPYGIATPSGPVQCKKASVIPASQLPLAGRIAHAAPAPAPAANAPAPAPKMQSQLQHLPRFQPPSFEGANGMLPCPDSPGSTPREDETPQVERLSQELDPPATQAREEEVPPMPAKVKRLPNGDAFLSNEKAEKPSSYAVGSFVEYKSRSSGMWILAKVEGFEESSQTYRLDVQPHANPERVRPRGSGTASVSTPKDSEALARDRDVPIATGELGQVTVPFRNGFDNNRLPPEPPTQQQQTSVLKDVNGGVEAVSPRMDYKDFNKRASGAMPTDLHDQSEEVECSSARYRMEIDSLKQQLSRLRSENEALIERVQQESALKDRYFNELCLCHEQTQRVRGTPR